MTELQLAAVSTEDSKGVPSNSPSSSTGERKQMTGQPENHQVQETPFTKLASTLGGVVMGLSLTALVIGFASNSYSILLRTAWPSPWRPPNKVRPSEWPLAQTTQRPITSLSSPPITPQLPERAAGVKSIPVMAMSVHPNAIPANQGQTNAREAVPQRVNVASPPVVPPPGVIATKTAPDKVQMIVKATHPLGSWIDVCADGQTIVRKYLPQLGTIAAGFKNDAVLRLGNSGGVEVALDGVQAAPLGRPGQPRVVRFSPGGLEFLVQGDPRRECGTH